METSFSKACDPNIVLFCSASRSTQALPKGMEEVLDTGENTAPPAGIPDEDMGSLYFPMCSDCRSHSSAQSKPIRRVMACPLASSCLEDYGPSSMPSVQSPI